MKLPLLLSVFLASLLGARATDCTAYGTRTAQENARSYGLMVDAGSSGNRMRVFSWTNANYDGFEEVAPLEDVEGNFENNLPVATTADAGVTSIQPLVEAAKCQVPTDKHASTPLFIKCTSGMRMLAAANAAVIHANIASAMALDANPFDFKSSQTISGEDEAVFGYLSTNFNLGSLENQGKDGALDNSTGFMDLGGASVQIIFQPPDEHDILAGKVSFYAGAHQDQRVEKFASSNPGFGQDKLKLRFYDKLIKDARSADGSFPSTTTCTADTTDYTGCSVENPCALDGMPAEYYTPANTVGGGNMYFMVPPASPSADAATRANSWKTALQDLVHVDYECTLEPCGILGRHFPRPYSGSDTVDFYAVSAFFYTVNGIGAAGWSVETVLSMAVIEPKINEWCSKDWGCTHSPIQAGTNGYDYGGDGEAPCDPADSTALGSTGSMNYAQNYCMTANYMRVLYSAWGISNTHEITYTRKVNGKTADWSLGAMLYEGPYMNKDGCAFSSGHGDHMMQDDDELDAGAGTLQVSVLASIIAPLLATLFAAH